MSLAYASGSYNYFQQAGEEEEQSFNRHGRNLH